MDFFMLLYLLFILLLNGRVYADAQRKRLGVVGEFEFRQPITEVDNCNIADVLFIS